MVKVWIDCYVDCLGCGIFYSPWVAKSQTRLSNWAYICIKSLGCIFNIYILIIIYTSIKLEGKWFKESPNVFKYFYKSTCKNDRMLIMFSQWALWGFIILYFDIPCMFKIFCCKKMKTELKFITITYFLVLALSEMMQSTVYITQLHLIYSPLKSLAEVGSLVTSLIRLPQIVLSSPHNYLIISISKLSNTLSPFSFCCLFCF